MKKVFLKLSIFIFLLLICNFQDVNAYMIRSKDCSYTLGHTLASKTSSTSNSYRLLYYSKSSYTSQISTADSVWQAMGKVMVLKSYISSNKDVTISDYSQADNILGVTNFKDYTMKFNTYNFKNMSTSEKNKTVLHEFGHALGLAHISTSGNVMKQGIISQSSLGSLDKSAYNCYWK